MSIIFDALKKSLDNVPRFVKFFVKFMNDDSIWLVGDTYLRFLLKNKIAYLIGRKCLICQNFFAFKSFIAIKLSWTFPPLNSMPTSWKILRAPAACWWTLQTVESISTRKNFLLVSTQYPKNCIESSARMDTRTTCRFCFRQMWFYNFPLLIGYFVVNLSVLFTFILPKVCAYVLYFLSLPTHPRFFHIESEFSQGKSVHFFNTESNFSFRVRLG